MVEFRYTPPRWGAARALGIAGGAVMAAMTLATGIIWLRSRRRKRAR